MSLIVDNADVTLHAGRIHSHKDEAEIFEQIFEEIYKKDEGGTKEIVALNQLRWLLKITKNNPLQAACNQENLERLIHLLEGPIYIFAELPATYNAWYENKDKPDTQSFLSTESYFDTMPGRKETLVGIAKRSITTLSSALILIDLILEEPLKTEYTELFKDLSNRISASGIISKFTALREPVPGWCL